MKETGTESVFSGETAEDAIRLQLNALEMNSSAYRSWGDVRVEWAAVRNDRNRPILVSGTDRDTSGIASSERKHFGVLASHIFQKRKRIRAILFSRQANAGQVREDIPPILDDQAQLLGPSLRFVSDAASPRKITAGLRGRFAINISSGITITIGPTLKDAYIAAQLAEKTSKAFLDARYLGGAKAINRFEAWAMHKFYRWTYSKQSEKNR
jgi:hypothetical protein